MRLVQLLFVACCVGLAAPPASAQRALLFDEDLIFRPVPSCRVFDTREGEPIAKNGVRTFYVAGARDMRAQGGPRAGCGVPRYATAVQLALSTTKTTKSGYAIAYPAGQPRRLGFGTVYSGPGLASASSVTLIGVPEAGEDRISVFSTSQAHVIGDISGYYMPKLEAVVNKEGNVINRTSRIKGSIKRGVGAYEVYVDLLVNAITCRAVVQPVDSTISAGVTFSSSSALITTRNIQTCQNEDAAFHILVSC